MVLGRQVLATHTALVPDAATPDPRAEALLAIAFRGRLPPDRLRTIAEAAAHARRGDHALANLRLAFASPTRVPEPDAIALRMELACQALDGGVPPLALLKALDLADQDGSARSSALARTYDPDQPRVPAGHGRESGRWGEGGDEPAPSQAARPLDGRVQVAANGDFPPPPPGYNPKTWTQDLTRDGKIRLRTPEGRYYTMHVEDDGHWRHWDVRGPDNNDEGQWPGGSSKRRPGQKQPAYGKQGPVDPSGDAKPWTSPDSLYVTPHELTPARPPIVPTIPETPQFGPSIKGPIIEELVPVPGIP